MPIPVAVGVVFDDTGRVLVARRPKHLHQGDYWEFPGGKLEQGEQASVALKRELKEELDIDVLAARPLIKLTHQYPDRSVLLDVFHVETWSGVAKPLEGQQLDWLTLDELETITLLPANAPIVSAVKLPCCYLITPEPGNHWDLFLARLEKCLNPGVRLVQLRAPSLPRDRYRELARETLSLCQRFSAELLLNAEPDLVFDLNAKGVHLTSNKLLRHTQRPMSKDYWVAASCHNHSEIQHACHLGVDFIVLGPVAPTSSHVGRQPMGWDGFTKNVSHANLPVYALGGMGPSDVHTAWSNGGQGIAAISKLWNAK